MNFDNTNTGVLFPNDKGDNPRRPDYRGTVNVNGAEFELSGWKKASKAGKPYLSISIQPKRDKPQREPAKGEEAFSDEIPF